METITKQLSEEHQNILKLTRILSERAGELSTGVPLDNVFFMEALKFIKGYADRFHHAKEEDILFKELCSKEVENNMHCNPVSQMLHEHDLGRGFVTMIEEGLEEDDRSKVADGCKGYAALLQDHIFKEDNILYPMAEEAIPKVIKERIMQKFNEINEKFHAEEYLKWLEQM